MTLNTKIILSAVGVAALLASPAMAKTQHTHAAPSSVAADTHTYAAPTGAVQTPYAPDVPVPAHTKGLNPDFQLGGEK